MNVGGKNTFRPAQLALALKHLDVVNVGAAGTFVVRGKTTESAIRREILSRLPFEPNIAVRPAREIVALVKSDPFAGVAFKKDMRGWVAVMNSRPKSPPRLPVITPTGKLWKVRFDRVDGAFALGLWHWRPGGFVFPSNYVEQITGIAATTRWWETIVRVAKIVGE